MDLRIFATEFPAVFSAERGDKTRLATLRVSADLPALKRMGFAGSATALVATAGIGVLARGWIDEHLDPKHLKLVAGAAFVRIGAWTHRSGFA